jgi:hypothetical protein
MRPTLMAAVLLLAACGGGSDVAAGGGVTSTLLNDGFSGAGAAFQGGFVSGEEAAVTLGPVDRSFKVTKVRLLFGGTAGVRTVTLRIYADAGTASPGTLLHSADFQITASDSAFQELDLSGANVTLPAGRVRVSLRFTADGLPCVARDGDGTITAGRNWIETGGTWSDASSLGVTGDWIIRAEVVTL